MTFSRHKWFVLFTIGAIPLSASSAHAQACYGTPSRSHIAYEYGTVPLGQSHGASLSLVGRRTALALGASVGDIEDVSAQDASLRFGLQFPAGKVQFCPALGLGFARRSSDPSRPFDVTSNKLSLGAGVGVGFEQEVFAGVSLIPFVAARYQFNLVYITIDQADADTEVSGDTVSTVDFQYGLTANWKVLFVGFSAQRYSDSERADFARIVVGLTFGGRSRKK